MRIRFHPWMSCLPAALMLLSSLPVHGLAQREPNSTLKLPLTPPARGYTTERAFGNLTLHQPVGMAVPPGETNRLFVIEQTGRVIVLPNLDQPERTVFLDLSDRVDSYEVNGLLAIAFHPGFATNRHLYLYYTLQTTSPAGNGLHNRLSRFTASPDNPDLALIDSEVVLIEQFNESGLHNGGDLRFGPDGFLYFSIGDEGWYHDSLNNSQRIDGDFFGGILRLDVDQQPGSLPPNPHPAASAHYGVPPDNPFVGATEFNGRPVDPGRVRTEFWAVGLRNAWRMHFDPRDGTLYCGDVGEANLEEVNVILKGGNYGWAFREGTTPGSKADEAPPSFSSINPIFQYYHGEGTNNGNATICGVVYLSDRLPGLTGRLILGDHVSGNLWAVDPDGTPWPPSEWLASDKDITSLGLDPRNGDILMTDLAENTLKRLTHIGDFSESDFPPTLAETGAFADVETLTPNPGIVPYEINLPFWSDGAGKRRWFSIPDTNGIAGFAPTGEWSFPAGTVWIKHFDLAVTNDNSVYSRRVETRFLVQVTQGWYGITYRWNESGTAATLVPAEGAEEHFYHEGSLIPRIQTWRYPSRNECLACHNPAAGPALGFNTAQLNRDALHNGQTLNQLVALHQAGYLDTRPPEPDTLPRLVSWTNAAYSLEYRVRSHLAVNCAQCHRPGGPSRARWDARLATPLSDTGIIDGLLNDEDGDPESRIVKPGSARHSMLLKRISVNGPDRMPPVASTVLDQQAVEHVRSWINNDLSDHQTFEQWQAAHFGTSEAMEAQPDADPDQDGAPNRLEFLTRTDPLDPDSQWKLKAVRNNGNIAISFERTANRGVEIQSTANLLDPGSWRILQSPGNGPFVRPTNEIVVIEEPGATGDTRYYRARIYEP